MRLNTTEVCEIKKIQEAEVEELLKVHEMDKKAAQAVYEFFHPKQ